jgi:hypothetical protein
MDYRLKENRREAFIRWYAWSLQYNDCDPAVWATNYLNDRYEHNDEERIWLAWLYGNTYQLPTAWVLKNEFPDYELADLGRITDWNSKNYTRLRYQTDTKWNKGHLPVMFESYQKFIGSGTQREKLESYYGDNESQNFDALWVVLKTNLHKFGRYSTWFYLQHLKHTAGIVCDPTSLMLDDYDGSRSHRNGLLLAIGRDDDIDKKLNASEYATLESIGSGIRSEMKDRFPSLASQVDYFTMETCLCSFKKIFRQKHGRYLSYYLDRQAEEIQVAESDGWAGIEWQVMWDARDETINQLHNHKRGINKERFGDFLATGQLNGLEMMFDGEQPIASGLDAFL